MRRYPRSARRSSPVALVLFTAAPSTALFNLARTQIVIQPDLPRTTPTAHHDVIAVIQPARATGRVLLARRRYAHSQARTYNSSSEARKLRRRRACSAAQLSDDNSLRGCVKPPPQQQQQQQQRGFDLLRGRSAPIALSQPGIATHRPHTPPTGTIYVPEMVPIAQCSLPIQR